MTHDLSTRRMIADACAASWSQGATREERAVWLANRLRELGVDLPERPGALGRPTF